MTYCLGILLKQGLVLASDSRSNAGVDQVMRVCKLSVMPGTGERLIVIQSAGNLATTQAVVTTLQEAYGCGDPARDLALAPTMFEVAGIVGGQLRARIAADASYVAPYGDASGNFLVSGQIRGEGPRLFQIYSAGNFVEASVRTPFLQIGETKYGKPILDRSVTPEISLREAARLAVLSFDATTRSNLSVAPPIDVLLYREASFSAANLVSMDEDDPYWLSLRKGYADGLASLVAALPPPPQAWGG